MTGITSNKIEMRSDADKTPAYLGRICSLIGFLEKVCAYYDERSTSEKKPRVHFFRGQCRTDWKLQPSVFRKDVQGQCKYNEKTHILDFKQYALNSGLHYDFVFDCDKVLCDMQHYGIPTRLLDWSVNPLVALFFACYDDTQETNKKHSTDGRVFIFDPWKYNNKVVNYGLCDDHQVQILARSLLAYHWGKSAIAKYLSKRFPHVILPRNKFCHPVAYVSQFTNNRQINQKGTFLIWGKSDAPLEMQPTASEFIRYIEVASYAKQSILDELNLLCINEFSVYPDYDGMRKMIKTRGGLFRLTTNNTNYGST